MHHLIRRIPVDLAFLRFFANSERVAHDYRTSGNHVNAASLRADLELDVGGDLPRVVLIVINAYVTRRP